MIQKKFVHNKQLKPQRNHQPRGIQNLELKKKNYERHLKQNV